MDIVGSAVVLVDLESVRMHDRSNQSNLFECVVATEAWLDEEVIFFFCCNLCGYQGSKESLPSCVCIKKKWHTQGKSNMIGRYFDCRSQLVKTDRHTNIEFVSYESILRDGVQQ